MDIQNKTHVKTFEELLEHQESAQASWGEVDDSIHGIHRCVEEISEHLKALDKLLSKEAKESDAYDELEDAIDTLERWANDAGGHVEDLGSPIYDVLERLREEVDKLEG